MPGTTARPSTRSSIPAPVADSLGGAIGAGVVATLVDAYAGPEVSPSELLRVTVTGTFAPGSTLGTSTCFAPAGAWTVAFPTVTVVGPQPLPPDSPSCHLTVTTAREELCGSTFVAEADTA